MISLLAATFDFAGDSIAQEQKPKALEIGKPFTPQFSAESALKAARAAVSKERFSPKAFEVHDMKQYDALPVDWGMVAHFVKSDIPDARKHQAELIELRKTFGDGPVWIVNFWRTERVTFSGNWWDDARFGLTAIVYHPMKVAIIDGRTSEDKNDKLK